MKRYTFFFQSVLFLALFFCVDAKVFAQAPTGSPDGPGNGLSALTLNVTPSFPEPFETVTATAKVSGVNIDALPVAWLLGGKVKGSGVGMKSFTFKVGDVGSATLLRVEVLTPESDFGLLTKETTIRPSDADVLWEADTYTPPFYKGKALPTSQSSVKIIAMPQFMERGARINPKNLIYKWKKGYSYGENDSGTGKNFFSYTAGYASNADGITMTISNLSGTLSVKKTIDIPVYEPKIVFYEKKPLENVRYEHALSEHLNLKEKEVILSAVPYFFSFSTPNVSYSNMDFVWQMDGKTLVPLPDRKFEFVFRKPEKGRGQANIQLKVTNNDRNLQSKLENLTLSYAN